MSAEDRYRLVAMVVDHQIAQEYRVRAGREDRIREILDSPRQYAVAVEQYEDLMRELEETRDRFNPYDFGSF